MKTLISMILLLDCASYGFTQCSSVLVGRVYHEQYQALPHALIQIEENARWMQSDSSGLFIFSNLSPRYYTVQACQGYAPQARSLALKPGRINGLAFILSSKATKRPNNKAKQKP